MQFQAEWGPCLCCLLKLHPPLSVCCVWLFNTVKHMATSEACGQVQTPDEGTRQCKQSLAAGLEETTLWEHETRAVVSVRNVTADEEIEEVMLLNIGLRASRTTVCSYCLHLDPICCHGCGRAEFLTQWNVSVSNKMAQFDQLTSTGNTCLLRFTVNVSHYTFWHYVKVSFCFTRLKFDVVIFLRRAIVTNCVQQ